MMFRASSLVAVIAALPLALPAQSIRNLTQGRAIRALWEPIVAAANRSVVEVCVDERAMVRRQACKVSVCRWRANGVISPAVDEVRQVAIVFAIQQTPDQGG